MAEAAARAPAGPGVYFFVAADRTLLYVGKAGHLRQRLRQHARPAARPRLAALQEAVAAVAWEETATEPAAADREADLIVALRPALNAAVVGDARWAYVVVAPAGGDGRLAFTLAPDPGGAGGAGGGRAYGCFPHLGRGVSTRPAIACSDGYAGLLRLLWAAGDPVTGSRDAMPRRIAGPAPPDRFATTVAPDHRRPLADLLAGTSDRLVAELAAAAAGRRSPALQPALRRDADAARGFFAAGPRAVRALRRRHGLPAGPLDRAAIQAALAAEVRTAIGELRLPDDADPTAGLLGRRDARTRTLRSTVRRLGGPGHPERRRQV